jgi:hypothetical protein
MTTFLEAVAIVSGVVGAAIVVWFLLGGNTERGRNR